MVQWWFRACAGGASLVAWSFCSPLLCSTAGDPLGGRLSGRPSVRLSVWDAVWGRARVVLGVSGVCVSGACSRGSSSSSSSSTTCCVLQLLFGSRYCMAGWVRSAVVMSEGIERRILAVAWRGTLCFRRTEPQRKCVGGGGGDE